MSDQKIMGADLIEHYDQPHDPLGHIFEMQKSFGSKFCPFSSLKDEVERRQWLVTFLDCIFDECSELLGWLPWKHWKSYDEFNLDEIEIRFELIDMLHFIVSEFLLFNLTPTQVLRLMGVKNNVDKGERLSHMLHRCKGLVLLEYELEPTECIDSQIELTRALLRKMISYVGKAYDGPAELDPYIGIFTTLCKLFCVWGMNSEDIYDYYMSKNKENFDRQERGY